MAHICLKGLGTGYGPGEGNQNDKCNEAVLINKADCIDRIYGQKNIQTFSDVYETEDRHYAEPEKRDWSKSLRDTPGTVALNQEQCDQDRTGYRQHPRVKGRRYELQTFDGR